MTKMLERGCCIVGTSIQKSPINGRTLVVYGAGNDAGLVIKKLWLIDISPAFCVARNASSKGNKLSVSFRGEKREFALRDPGEIDKSKHFVVVASSKYSDEMEEFLIDKGAKKNVDYFVWDVHNPSVNSTNVRFFVSMSTMSQEQLNKVYYTSCDSLRKTLALTTNPNRDYRIRFCFPEKYNWNSNLPEVIYVSDIERFVSEVNLAKSQVLDAFSAGEVIPNGWCNGCWRPRKDIWLDPDDMYSVINVGGHPAPCNFKCSYCDARSEENTVEFSKKMLGLYQKTLDTLKAQSKLSPDAVISLANGEITVNPAGKEFLKLADGYYTIILTNASVFSQDLAERLKKGDAHLFVSVDAGTRESFKKSKGVDAFDRVRENLKRYRQFGAVILKYILLEGINDDDANIDGVIDLCRYLDIDRIWLSTDMFLLESPHGTSSIVPILANVVRKMKWSGIEAYNFYGFLENKDCETLEAMLSSCKE